MAIDSNGSGTTIGRSATVPNDDPFTAIGWWKLNADLNAGGWGFFITDSGSNGFGVSVGVDGTTLALTSTEDGITNSSLSMVLGTWYPVALRRSGTSLRINLDTVVVASQSLAAAFTPNAIVLFSDHVAGAPTDSSWAYLRLYERELTDYEVFKEFQVATPTSPGVWADYRFVAGAVTDSSGNGRDLTTAIGTPIADTDPALMRRYLLRA